VFNFTKILKARFIRLEETKQCTGFLCLIKAKLHLRPHREIDPCVEGDSLRCDNTKNSNFPIGKMQKDAVD